MYKAPEHPKTVINVKHYNDEYEITVINDSSLEDMIGVFNKVLYCMGYQTTIEQSYGLEGIHMSYEEPESYKDLYDEEDDYESGEEDDVYQDVRNIITNMITE